MMKTITLAASMMVLVAISGQASAGTAAADMWHCAHASAHPMRAYDAVAPATAQPNAHRYHGGPKVND